MKIPTTYIAVAIASAMLATSHGAGYVTSFDPPAFLGNQSLSGQELWDTNNYSDNGTPLNPLDDLGQSDFVGILAGYSTTVNDYWALLGGGTGVAPVVNTSTLFRPVDLSLATSAAFNVNFGIISSQSPRLNKDTFGWTFRDASGNQLLRVSFIPDTNQPNNLTVRVFDAANTQLAGSGAFNILYDAKYELSINLSSASLVSVGILPTNGDPATQIINNQLASGTVASAIADVAATWSLFDVVANPNGERPNYGSNSMVFDNYAVTSVPEATTGLFGLAVGVLGIGARRRQRAA